MESIIIEELTVLLEKKIDLDKRKKIAIRILYKVYKKISYQ